MGVAGSGKTTVGRSLADSLGWPFIEGDHHHPDANIQKMSRGEALTDADRQPWLLALRREIEQRLRQGESAVMTCSALKRDYRAILRGEEPEAIRFVYLKVSPAELRSRLLERTDHFMQVEMLESQLATLEEPENAIIIDVDHLTSVAAIVQSIQARL